METIAVVIALLDLLLVLVVVFRAERRYRELPLLRPDTTSADQLPSVSVVIPARNESGVIRRVATSLCALHYPAEKVSLLVVDDQSSDGTGKLASEAGATVLRLDSPPPAGWTGKCHASHQGVQASAAEWILFTDADTCHAPDSLSTAVRYAQQHKLDALSLLLQQECVTMWERLVLPIAYQNMFAALSETPTFNGQYILIRRDVYTASGGYALVQSRVMEDVALARALTGRGYRVALANGNQLASVRMYQRLPALLRGMTKTAFVAARDSGPRGFLLALPFFLGAWMLPLAVIGWLDSRREVVVAALLPMVVTTLGLLPWLRRFRVPAYYALASYIGLTLLWAVGLASTTRGLLGVGVRWKDRTIHDTRP